MNMIILIKIEMKKSRGDFKWLFLQFFCSESNNTLDF